MVSVCTDPKGFTRQVNEELMRLWEQSTGHDPLAASKLMEVDAKVANVRKAIEDGLEDAGWANGRLRELMRERDELADKVAVQTQPPRIDIKTAMAYRRKLETLFKHGSPADKKRLLRTWVEEIRLAPERLEVEITYRVPEPVMNSVVAGAGFEPATFGL